MNKSELVAAVASRSGSTQAEAGRVIDALVDEVTAELAKGGEVAILGFGKFSTSKRAARTGRNPQTGETIKIAASTSPKFTAGAALKNAVNAKKKKK